MLIKQGTMDIWTMITMKFGLNKEEMVAEKQQHIEFIWQRTYVDDLYLPSNSNNRLNIWHRCLHIYTLTQTLWQHTVGTGVVCGGCS